MTGPTDHYQDLFASFSETYDIGNHIMSFCIDILWRKMLVGEAAPTSNMRILDVCTGTADVVIEFCRRCASCAVCGLDVSGAMLSVGQEKMQRKCWDRSFDLLKGDALALPFGDDTYDIVTNVFSLRLVSDYTKALAEMRRVAKKGGKIMILEFSMPPNPIISRLYKFHLDCILPAVRGVFGEARQYAYLRVSILKFSRNVNVVTLMADVGLQNIQRRPLTFGTAVLYVGEK